MTGVVVLRVVCRELLTDRRIISFCLCCFGFHLGTRQLIAAIHAAYSLHLVHGHLAHARPAHSTSTMHFALAGAGPQQLCRRGLCCRTGCRSAMLPLLASSPCTKCRLYTA